MLKFPHDQCKQTKDKAHYITDRQIEDFVEIMLENYKKELLEKAQVIDWQDFLEFYLECRINFANILQKGDEDVLGICSFADKSKLPVYNEDANRDEYMYVDKGEVVLNSLLTKDPKRKQQLLFTALHEGGHWVLHQPYFFAKNVDDRQMGMFTKEDPTVHCCRTSDIEGDYEKKIKSKTNMTQAEHIEHQANVFAAAVAVPRKTLRAIIPSILQKYDHKLRKRGKEINLEIYSKESDITEEVANILAYQKESQKSVLNSLVHGMKKTQ